MAVRAGLAAPMLRRSIVSLTVLAAILVGVGSVVVWLGVPIWAPLTAALLIVAGQYAGGPWLIEHLIPAAVTGVDSPSGDRVQRMLSRRCEEAGLHDVRLGIIDDGTPNAFTFGHHRGDARIWLSRGLIERLNDEELDAVIAHEVSHVVHGDFIVMTFASVVPILAYYVFLGARTQQRAEGLLVSIGAYAVYLVSTLVVLGLARSRELAADHRSCEVTGAGDALCSALIKISYGIGQVEASRRIEARQAFDAAKDHPDPRSARGEARTMRRRAARRSARFGSVSMLGITDPAQARAVALAIEEGVDEREVLGALRWEACSPWSRVQELLSSHPVAVHRIAALERSGLPGAPTGWAADRVATGCDERERRAAWARFLPEVALRYLGWAGLLTTLVTLRLGHVRIAGWSLVVGGGVLLCKYAVQHPLWGFSPVERITSLLGRTDASPVRSIPVEVTGRVIGRATPGYVLSPDLVVQDQSGFVPVLYRQPIPFSRALFAVMRAGKYADTDVTIRGWYRRTPTPVIEVRDVTASSSRLRSWQWVVGFITSPVLVLVGFAMVVLR